MNSEQFETDLVDFLKIKVPPLSLLGVNIQNGLPTEIIQSLGKVLNIYAFRCSESLHFGQPPTQIIPFPKRSILLGHFLAIDKHFDPVPDLLEGVC